jgi:hypothetical protein
MENTVSHNETIAKPTDIYVSSNNRWAQVPWIAGVIGLLGIAITVASMFGEHKRQAFFSYLWAFEIALSLALGALGFVLIQHIVRAGWSAVVRRIAEMP